MKYSDNGYMMELAGDKYYLKNRYDLTTMKKYNDLSVKQERFLEKVIADSDFHIGVRYKNRINKILQILVYLEEDKKMLNKIGDSYKKYQDEIKS